MKKALVLTLALVLVLAIGIGGTVAWLSASTDEVVNTFTMGKVDLTLTETDVFNNYKVAPGAEITKDPTVTVESGSEKSYVFLKVEKAENFDNYFSYVVNTADWTVLSDDENAIVYYHVYDPEVAGEDGEYEYFVNNTITVPDTVSGFGADNPGITFTAYAIQYTGFETNLNGAWSTVSAPAA